MGRNLLSVIAAVGLLGLASSASAQLVDRDGPDTRLGFHGVFGFGGEAEQDVDGSSIFDRDYDLETTFGFGLVVEHAIHKFVLFGARFETAWWNTDDWDDNDIDRSVILDFDGQGKVRFPFMIDRAVAEVSFTVPIGLSISIPSDDIPGDPNTGVGFNVAFLGGFGIMFGGGFGFYGEIGWHIHSLAHELQDTDTDVDVSTGQLVMHAGFMFGF